MMIEILLHCQKKNQLLRKDTSDVRSFTSNTSKNRNIYSLILNEDDNTFESVLLHRKEDYNCLVQKYRELS